MKLVKYWSPSVIIALIIFVLSSRPRISITHIYTTDFIIFKTVHMLEYGLFFLANYRAAINTLYRNSRSKAGILALTITIAYALTDEIHQTFVPTRDGKIRDIMFDTIGAVVTYIWIEKYLPQAPKKLKQLAKLLQII